MTLLKKQYVLEIEDISYIVRHYPPGSLAKLLVSYPKEIDKFKLEVFYDDSLDSYKGIMFYFAGGSGNWEVPLTSPLTDIAKNGYIVVNWSAMKSNNSLNVNRFSQWVIHNYKHWGAEANCALDYFFGKVFPTLFKDNEVNMNTYLFGHSRGAGLVSMWGGYSNSDRSIHSKYVKGIAASSPAGGVFNQPFNSLRSFTNTLQQTNLPLVITVGAGDLTHTTRSFIERVNPIVTNELVSIEVIGDANNKHNSFNDDYWMWFQLCKPIIDSYYKDEELK